AAHLVRGRVRDLCPPVADVREPQPRGGVEVALPAHVPHVGALATDERQLTAGLQRGHVRERVPEGRHDGRCSQVTGLRRERAGNDPGGSQPGGTRHPYINVETSPAEVSRQATAGCIRGGWGTPSSPRTRPRTTHRRTS